MSRRYARELTADELAVQPDDAIDYSEIPELDEAFWRTAKLVQPEKTEAISLRVKTSVLEAFRAQGRGYQSRMNAVLEAYVRTLPQAGPGADQRLKTTPPSQPVKRARKTQKTP
ncbi:3-oxoacyl-ACP synthase [Arsenicitalea aurantiaca]|uniref:3-oxoacyl-ACP synthase n=1 Tax=Arsenicitalea aurantiaca TaxID=1783274 RepID=A0A433XKF8_9HYPH|nr:BrnA antitoxin family protein [Arsenicitalea aurantiaca]RUT34508.1 3-oxoacyl-ACP synthase [Arsenicitalea aurantiaca]